MGGFLQLGRSDGRKISGYRAEPAGPPLGGLVVCQEIFGVNSHIRDVTDRFAAAGYVSIAPALFDRVKPGVELGYDAEGIAAGRGLMQKCDLDQALLDIAAAIAAMPPGLKIGVVGYCWGGTLAWASATRLTGLSCAVAYYGGGIGGLLGESPKCPVLMHFGEKDQSIPMDVVAKARAAHPTIPVYTYDAGHGFNCNERGSYDEAAASAAGGRTKDFLRQHLN